MSGLPATLDLRPDQLAIVQDILHCHIPERKVLAFGSRVRGKAKKYSDIDLAVLGDTPLPFSISGSLDEAFDESPLIYKVDVVDWALTSPAFREVIMQNAVVVQEGASP